MFEADQHSANVLQNINPIWILSTSQHALDKSFTDHSKQPLVPTPYPPMYRMSSCVLIYMPLALQFADWAPHKGKILDESA